MQQGKTDTPLVRTRQNDPLDRAPLSRLGVSWQRKRSADLPSLAQSPSHLILGDASRLRPLRKRATLSADHQVAIRASVVGLLLPGCPATVSRLVVPVVVYPIDSQMGLWPVAHVSQEVAEAQPALANRDASSAIVRVRAACRAEAAPLHVAPDLPKHLIGRAVPTNRGDYAPSSRGTCREVNPRRVGLAVGADEGGDHLQLVPGAGPQRAALAYAKPVLHPPATSVSDHCEASVDTTRRSLQAPAARRFEAMELLVGEGADLAADALAVPPAETLLRSEHCPGAKAFACQPGITSNKRLFLRFHEHGFIENEEACQTDFARASLGHGGTP